MLTSARFIAIGVYKVYDFVMTVHQFVRLQILSVTVGDCHATNLQNFSLTVNLAEFPKKGIR